MSELEAMVSAADAGLHPRIRAWVPDRDTRLEALREELEWWVEVATRDLDYARDYRRHQPQSDAPPERYLDRWLAADTNLWVQAGPRYRSRDPAMPFVGVVGANRPIGPDDLPRLRALAVREFAEFEPRSVLIWSAAVARAWPGTDADARLLAGRLGDLRAQPLPAELNARPLSRVGTAEYDRYLQMHAAHGARNPEHLRHTRPNAQADLAGLARDGDLWAVDVGEEWAGVIAARLDVASGMHGAIVVELILDPAFTGRGYGRHLSTLLARQVAQPDHRLLFGTIHADNRPAVASAQAAGREDVGGEVVVPLVAPVLQSATAAVNSRRSATESPRSSTQSNRSA